MSWGNSLNPAFIAEEKEKEDWLRPVLVNKVQKIATAFKK